MYEDGAIRPTVSPVFNKRGSTDRPLRGAGASFVSGKARSELPATIPAAVRNERRVFMGGPP